MIFQPSSLTDHSIHCMRLWALSKAKHFCSEWNMDMFFKVAHNDIENCLDNLHYLRVPELVPADPLEVLIEVCVKLRAKLVSEIKANIFKLKVSNKRIERDPLFNQFYKLYSCP